MKKYLFLLLFTLPLFSDLGVIEKLGTTVPLDLTFLDENAKQVTLRELMDGKPTLLTLNYFRCAGICTPQLNDLAYSLNRVKLSENTDYKVISVDFAEEETPKLARTKKANILNTMNRAYVKNAWRFVIGENNSSGKLAESIGFAYKAVKMENGKMGYIHGAIIAVLSPEGKITRYLEGIRQLPADITLALNEAKEGKVGKTILKSNSPFCFTKTPEADHIVNTTTRIAGVMSVLLLLGFFFFYLRKTKKK